MKDLEKSLYGKWKNMEILKGRMLELSQPATGPLSSYLQLSPPISTPCVRSHAGLPIRLTVCNAWHC